MATPDHQQHNAPQIHQDKTCRPSHASLPRLITHHAPPYITRRIPEPTYQMLPVCGGGKDDAMPVPLSYYGGARFVDVDIDPDIDADVHVNDNVDRDIDIDIDADAATDTDLDLEKEDSSYDLEGMDGVVVEETKIMAITITMTKMEMEMETEIEIKIETKIENKIEDEIETTQAQAEDQADSPAVSELSNLDHHTPSSATTLLTSTPVRRSWSTILDHLRYQLHLIEHITLISWVAKTFIATCAYFAVNGPPNDGHDR
ncbi:hypothetical protein B0A52_06317 [Exophiala mesophila]|uniref:Uncharacterized protein n=1 Tax=Exophiala mesophila TaxID=212818 RepID=A0A438N3C0_EXOME|nr:hypothetical protein B0A52_06317 [Exophiala mesophila]